MTYRIVLPALALLALPAAALGAPMEPAAPARVSVQDDAGQDAKKTPKRTAKRRDDVRGVGDGQRGKKPVDDGDGATPEKKPARPSVTVEELRAAFAREYFARKDGAAAELDKARQEFGADETAFAAKRTEIARKYRGELVSLQKSYVDKAKAAGLDLGLPADARQLEAAAAQAAPEAALRSRFAEEVARLTEAAQKELDAARTSVGGDRAAFAAKRTEIARKYRGQAAALQQQFAQRAAGMGATLDTSGAAKVLAAFAAAPAKPVAASSQKAKDDAAADSSKASDADANKKDGAGSAGQGQPLDAQTLRTAFAKRVETIRTEAAGELAAADGSLQGAALTAKRVEIARRYRSQLGRVRQLFADRAAAAGVTMPLPTDEDLVPELVAAAGAGSTPAPPPPTPEPAKGDDKKNGAGQKGGDDKKGEDESTPEKKGDADGEKKADDEKTPPSKKRGSGPRWGRKNG